MPLDSTAVFNEIHYNPASNQNGGEWIELFNQLHVDLDLSGWSLQGGIDYTFPVGTKIPARGYLVIAETPVELQAATGLPSILGPWQGQLNNSGEALLLVTNDGRRINQMEYGDDGDWPVAADGSGATLAKREELTSPEFAENWTFSRQVGGTPGAVNFPGEQTSELLGFYPFDGDYRDAGFFGNDGTAFGSVPFDANGYEGSAISFTGNVNNFVRLQIDASTQNRASLTWGAWVKTADPLGDINTILSTDDGGWDRFLFHDGGKWAVSNGSGVEQSTADVTTDWTFVAATFDAGMQRLYVDGDSPVLTTTDPNGPTLTYTEIGRNANACSFCMFDGLIDNVFLFDSALNTTEIAAIRAGGAAAILDLADPADDDPAVLAQQFAGLEISEIAGADDVAFFVELHNRSAEQRDLAGLRLETSNGEVFALPATSLPAGGYLALDEGTLGFRPLASDKLFLYADPGQLVLDGRMVENVTRGLSNVFDSRWLFPATPTPGVENEFQFENAIVINEIFYHGFPQLATDTQPFVESAEEWIELTNRGDQPIDLTGWRIDDAIGFEFPVGTTIAPGEFLVIANDAATLAARYPDISILGDFSGQLNNSGERILLLDAVGNPADEVHYFEGGRWPEYADGGGSSLELRNVDADNARGEAWAASDEAANSVWRQYIVRGTVGPDWVGALYNEFIFGLLDSGEFLIDDIHVVVDPDGEASEMMQNGTFDDDVPGTAPFAWRLIGNHAGTVIADPDDASNQVLHVIAHGAQAFVHDHAETTFVGNTPIDTDGVYEISFRAKWLAGNSQLNNRLYFSRLANTVQLEVPANHGTPGLPNSTTIDNVGPTFDQLSHGPILPAADEEVTVAVQVADPQGVDTVDLWYRPDGQAFASLPMVLEADGFYRARLPGQAASTVVQFYVEARDTLGAVSHFPAAGPDSRALYQVNDSRGTTRPVDTVRVVMLETDHAAMFSQTERMSNFYRGITLIRNGEEAFYNAAVRQSGSRFIRPNSGYVVQFNPEQLYLGVHSAIRFDFNGQHEILFKQMVNAAGGSEISLYDDIAYLVSPVANHTGMFLINLSRFEDVFLEEQFENGDDGTIFELDDVTYPTNPVPSPEGLKDNTGVASPDISDRGDDPELQRGHILIKNNRSKDDYGPIVAMADAIHKTGDELDAATQATMDVDLWMRHYATQAFLGNWDTYGFRRPKNLRMYIRPSDNKVIPLYWDADLANLTEPLIYNGAFSRLDDIRDIPHNLRLFYGHLWDLMNRSFNAEYAGPWADHFTAVSGINVSAQTAKIAARVTQSREHILTVAPQIPFGIFTANGTVIDDVAITLEGQGWIDVRQIRLAGSGNPLPVEWTGFDTWQVTLPLAPGANSFDLEAYDYEGNLISTQSIDITSTANDARVVDALRVSEIHYHPPDPTAAEIAAGFTDEQQFEFIELVNTSGELLQLAGVTLYDGVGYTFDSFELPAGGFVVVANDPVAFAARHATDGMLIVGPWDAGVSGGALSNGGEQIVLLDGFGQTVQDFTYDDTSDWHDRADGDGSSLEVLDTTGDYNNPENWRPSSEFDGSPGVAGEGPRGDVVVNEVLAHTDLPQYDTIELYNTTDAPIDISGWYLSDSRNYRKFRIPDRTILAANDYLTFDETDFNSSGLDTDPANDDPRDFALSSAHGETLHLLEATGDDRLFRFVEEIEFGGTLNGMSLGRWPNGTGELFPMTVSTLGEPNDALDGSPVQPRIMLSEVHYNSAEATGDDLEFLELYNTTGQFNDLTEWRIRSGVDFDLPAGLVIEPFGVLVVVSFDPLAAGDVDQPSGAERLAAFRSFYGIDESVIVVGGYAGSLRDVGERLELQSPDEPPLEEPDFTPHVLADLVIYDDESPWPSEAAGQGQSLHRSAIDAFGNASDSWFAATPSPGSYDGPRSFQVASTKVLPGGIELRFAGELSLAELNLYDGPDAASDAPDVTLVGANVGRVAGSLIVSPTTGSVTFIKTGGPLVPDDYVLHVASRNTGVKATDGQLLDGNGDFTAGDDFDYAFSIAASDARIVSLPDLTNGPRQLVQVAGETSIPITIDNGSEITDIALTFAYDANSLQVFHVAASDGLEITSLQRPTPNQIRLALSVTDGPLSVGEQRLLSLSAVVDANIARGAAQVVSIESILLNNGAIAAIGDQAVHVAAYPGDATNSGDYSALDAALIARVTVGHDSGFDELPLYDPILIADVTGNGRLSALDASFVARVAVGEDQPEIPPIPPVPAPPNVSPAPPSPTSVVALDAAAIDVAADSTSARVANDAVVQHMFAHVESFADPIDELQFPIAGAAIPADLDALSIEDARQAKADESASDELFATIGSGNLNIDEI
ncbi:MAG: lamin tail domain-containing protein [Planctomycetales bacterium]|nr:lamin tail domain-containing protein [Planctomycetales bacterium]